MPKKNVVYKRILKDREERELDLSNTCNIKKLLQVKNTLTYEADAKHRTHSLHKK